MMDGKGPSVADIASARVAWWQLGFARRREVLRLARRGEVHPDPDVWRIATAWAWQTLSAPWWWRAARLGAAWAVAMFGVSAPVWVLAEDPRLTLAISLALTVGPLAASTRWQARGARCVGRLVARPPVGRAPRRAAVAAALAVVVSVVGSVPLAHTAWQGWTATGGCPPVTLDPPHRDAWTASDGEHGVHGCPLGGTRDTADGQRYTPFPDGRDLYVVRTVGAIFIPAPIARAWQAAGGARGRLGYPVDVQRSDGTLDYLNFQGGHITMAPGAAARTTYGRRHVPAERAGRPCVAHDRPCIVTAELSHGDITLAWQYGRADAYNVAWWVDGEITTRQVEVAGSHHTLAGVASGAVYVFAVQACDKRFLRRSDCTPWSPTVSVHTPGRG